jgi:hypothetical protein
MKILLISPRLAIQKRDFLGSGVPYWPVDLAVFSSFLKQNGEDVCVVDLFGSSPITLEEKTDFYLQGNSIQSISVKMNLQEFDLVIIYAISYMSHQEIVDIVRQVKKQNSRQTVAILENSQAVTAYAVDAVAKEFFDCGVDVLLCGEMYWNWDDVKQYLHDPINETLPDNLLIANPPKSHVLRRKTVKHPHYPVPAWEYFQLENYWSIPYSHGPKTKRYLPILTSRGCPYPCDFCVVPELNNSRWRGSTPEDVVNEIIELRDKFNVHDFQIEDLNPTVKGTRWEKICALLIKKQAGISFYFVSGTKAETVDISKISLYANAGCKYISISPESGSPKLLKKIGKPFKHDYALNLIKACYEHGIYTQACMLVGHPNESDEDHLLSCDYIKSMVRSGLDEVAIFVVSPLAGSELYLKSNIKLSSHSYLPSFSPRGRVGWKNLAARRSQLIKIFFLEKLKRGKAIWLQGIRALLGTPRTKMENLPRRMAFIYWLILKHKLKAKFSSGKNNGFSVKTPT